MPVDPVCFIDTETSGLDPERHEIWEVALLIPDASLDGTAVIDHHYFLRIDERFADPIGLAIGRYDDRHPKGRSYRPPSGITPEYVWDPAEALRDIARLTHRLHLVGAIPSFDEERLRRAMLQHGIRPSWHYHIIDVEALAVGYACGRSKELAAHGWTDHPEDRAAIAGAGALCPPWKSDDLSRLIGVDPEQFDRHTAMGDAAWAAAIYRAVMGQ